MSAKRKRKPSIVGIGASAGGIQALQDFFSVLPADLGHAYAVILHLSPHHKSNLRDILARQTTMPVTEVRDSEMQDLEPNHVYVISPDRKLEITDSSIGASPFDEPRGQRAAIDVFFRSLAASHGDGFAIVLSGGGSDGALGAKAVKEAGGLVLVQDPAEAQHGAMPESALAAGVADVVAPVRELATHLVELTANKERVTALIEPAAQKKLKGDDETALQRILDLVRSRTGHDFAGYKRNTILRRLARRMQLNHTTTFTDYLKYLRENVEEVRALLDDLLITVTSFFRDPDAWEVLRDKVVGPIVEEAGAADPIRVWAPACATGEEAYSLAILFREEIDRRNLQRELLIFASDVDDGALVTARDGRYPVSIATDVAEDRLDRFFRKRGSHYRISGDIRNCIVFAQHSVLRDPPFSGLNLISCRNLLIYLDRQLQEQVHAVFRYACREDGYLFLGISESGNATYFEPLDKRYRIFRARPRSDGARWPLPDFSSVRPHRELPQTDFPKKEPRPDAGEIHVASLERYAPPSLLIDAEGNILHLSDSAGRYLQHRGGKPGKSIADLLRPELRDVARSVLEHAFAVNEARMSAFTRVCFDGKAQEVCLLVQPRPPIGRELPTAIVFFLEAAEAADRGGDPEKKAGSGEHVVAVLREKLRGAEQRIDSMNVEHDVTNQDLRAANEELQSLNEEYRSTAEELETSKEELQSVNEELQTINNELKAKLDETARAHNDLENLMAATDIATLFLDRSLTIKRFTPRLADIFNVKPHDTGRRIADFTHNLVDEDLAADARMVLRELAPIEHEVVTRKGDTLMVRLRPYRTSDDKIEGVVATFIDITQLKQNTEALRDSENRLEAELAVTRRLHRMSMVVATAESQQEALDEILRAAIELHQADLGNIQLLEKSTNRLHIVSHHGFKASLLRRFDEAVSQEGSASVRAVEARKPVRIVDVLADDEYAPHREFALKLGYRAVQSTPLLDSSGAVIGILSTHFREPLSYTDRDEQLADLLARQAAALIESRRQREHVIQLNAELQQRTSELESSEQKLRQQTMDLLRQDRAKEDFLSMLGHELRNPLAAIRNSLDLVDVARSMPTESAQRSEITARALSIVGRQSRHMTRLVNDLLDISRVNQGKLRLEAEPLDIRGCITDVVDALRSHCEANKLTLKLDVPDVPLCVDADAERLVQILDNLMQNAVNFTDPGGEIAIGARQEDGQVRISVRDSGIGIDPDKIDSLFEPYRQEGDGSRGGGLGLGLTLAKRLVELHGGTISAHSDGTGRGSEFVVRLPAAVSRPAPTATPRRDIPSVRILVVDDNADNAESFGALLSGLGHETAVAYGGKSALDTAHRMRPNVAFVDITMPEMDGFEVARLLREGFRREELMLVALSGHAITVDGTAFDHHLMKPASLVAVSELLESVAHAT